MFYHITDIDFAKQIEGSYVGTVKRKTFQFWIPCILRMMPPQEDGVLSSAQSS